MKFSSDSKKMGDYLAQQVLRSLGENAPKMEVVQTNPLVDEGKNKTPSLGDKLEKQVTDHIRSQGIK